MTDPRLSLNLRTQSEILRRTNHLFTSPSLFFTFLSLSFLVFLYRTSVETGTHLVTSFVDRDPSLRSLLSRLQISTATSPHPTPSSSPLHLRRRRNRSFLHLTRVGTLDDDFFSGDDDDERTLFGSNRRSRINGSFVHFVPRLGFSQFVDDNGIVLNQIVRPGFILHVEASTDLNDRNHKEQEGQNGNLDDINGSGSSSSSSNNNKMEEDVVGSVFPKGLDDSITLIFLVCFLSAAYGLVILGFLVTYSWVLGITFVTVVNGILGRESSYFGTLWGGGRLGMKKLSSFILLRWAIRDAFTQLLGLWYFGEIENQYSFFRLFVRLKLMPFSIVSPWIRGFEREVSGFLAMWFLVDAAVSLVFAVDSWVVIVNSRRGGREMVKEGCYLLSTMWNQAIQLKCLEAVLAGSLVRYFVSQYFGKYIASYFQAIQEVYFMVVWLLFYFAARCKERHAGGRRFGRRDLEGFAEGFR